jgi:lysophospholipase L1-like esterase
MNLLRSVAEYIRAHRPLQLAALVFFVAGLSALIVAATLSVPDGVLDVVLGLFAVSSLIWVIVQFVSDLIVPRMWVVITGGILVIAGGILLVTFYFLLGPPSVGAQHADRLRDALPLIGWSSLYLGSGWLVQAARESSWRRGWRWWVSGLVFGGGALLAVVVVLILPHSSKGAGYITLLALLGVALLLLLPFGLNLLSADALTARIVMNRSNTAWIGLAGVVLFGAPLIAVGFVTHSWLVVGVLASVALVLVFALASDTHLDVAIVIATIAVIAAAPIEVTPPSYVHAGAGQHALVALGDSYMSGEGAQKFFSGTDEGGGDECRRAPTAYAALATGPGQQFDDLTFLACSGARTWNVIATSDDPDAGGQTGELGTQVDQLKQLEADNPSFDPSLAIVSLGGNDAGFASIGEMCLLPGNCDTQRALFEDNLPSVGQALLAAYASIRAALPNVPIVAVPYPQPVASESSCGNEPLAASERAFVQQFVSELNSTIRTAAQQEGLYYMDTMPDALAKQHLQLCDPKNNGRPGLNTLSVNSVSGTAQRRISPEELLHDSLHPNERGHQAMLAAFDAWLAANPNRSANGPAASAAPVPPAAAANYVASTTPPCSLTTAGKLNCGVQARTWELQQLTGWWWLVFPALIAVAGAWLISIAGLSRIPRSQRSSGPPV